MEYYILFCRRHHNETAMKKKNEAYSKLIYIVIYIIFKSRAYEYFD